MRIAIDYRVLSTEAAGRGMGRYTQQQLREVLKRDKENQYFLLCFPNMYQDMLDPTIKKAKNVNMLQVGLFEQWDQHALFPLSKTLSFSSQFQELLYKHKIDIYHATTPFIGPALPDFDVCPHVATLYDLIPLIYPQEYFPDEDMAQTYRLVLRFLRKSRRIISISNSAKLDSYYYLGYPFDDNAVAYPTIDPAFRQLSDMEAFNIVRALFEREQIPKKFIFSVTGIHFSKNAALLLQAFNALPEAFKDEYPLVICFPNQAAEKNFQIRFGLQKNIHYLNAVTEDELAALYSLAQFVVHPSIYEGFGYPVAEAMACGTPVITTKSSSLEEIGKDAAILVDPFDPMELMQAMRTLIDVPEKTPEMVKSGLSSLKRFSPEQLGNITLDSYHKALESQSQNNCERKRIAIFSSLPPQHCGVADYTSELIKTLSQNIDLDIFVDSNYLPADILKTDFVIHHYSGFNRRQAQQKFDVIIYQMGATFYQYFMYPFISNNPGIVVFHDLIMGLGFYFIYNDKGDLDTFRQMILKQENPDILERFDQWFETETHDIAILDDLFRKNYLLNWIINHSLGQVVHMPDARKAIKVQYPNSDVNVISMGVRDMLKEHNFFDTDVYKLRTNIPIDHLVIGVFGSVVRVKRIESCLRAVKGLAEKEPKVLLLIVGGQIDPDYSKSLVELANSLGIEEKVRFTGRTSQEAFDNYFLSSDLVINLRYPSYKGMSAILIRALSAGKPVIISDIPEWRNFPDEFCFKVSPDQHEPDQILEHMLYVFKDPNILGSLKVAARDYFLGSHTIEHMTEQYINLIDSFVMNQS